ncbi:MAG TPA: hypothetical protein VF698_12700, partial [Thermoanaerobaculia bacterium]
MNVFRRLYGYLRRYKAWALLAFGSMVIFAITQTMLMALVRPLFDEVLSPPAVKAAAAKDAPREDATKERILDTILRRDRPEGQRGFAIDTFDRVRGRFDAWWNEDPAIKWRKVLTVLLIVFIVRAFTSFLSEYAFQKVGLSTVRDLRNDL